MEAEARYTLVGTIVLIVSLLLIAGLLWLAGGADRVSYRHYTIYFTHQSMDGLDVSSAVKMRGIKVGVVDSYQFAGGGLDAVRMDIKVDQATPIRSNAEALVKRNFVTGVATIEIRNPDATSPLLTEVLPNERYPVIAEGKSDLDNVANALSKMAENGAQVLDKVNLLLSDANRKGISDTIQNLQAISTNLADNKQAFNTAVQSIHDAADEFRVAGVSITRAARSAESSIQSVGKNADGAINQATTAMENLQRQTSDVSNRLQGLAEIGTLEFTSVSRDLRSSADAVSSAGQRLSNPRGILFGTGKPQPGPGE
ncbi:ABC transporter substrate-binding protein [Sulfuriferula plumbiphila]|uniref:ABC transporter substrate-binding protein n=1 Tax=Sulfuriferula plumbiphila TaxID=171865 RepID=A0A512L3C7_9PROT|nr:MlaD family protein [Sulfuriferula plumbiphila]BBP02679.1 ABC transporter substrate-binding protein [Sulfuriferula plumbiphila]GEP28973.1 ABC transporter substrate-binding protein [Sulfuriferula plumbiphila]